MDPSATRFDAGGDYTRLNATAVSAMVARAGRAALMRRRLAGSGGAVLGVGDGKPRDRGFGLVATLPAFLFVLFLLLTLTALRSNTIMSSR